MINIMYKDKTKDNKISIRLNKDNEFYIKKKKVISVNIIGNVIYIRVKLKQRNKYIYEEIILDDIIDINIDDNDVEEAKKIISGYNFKNINKNACKYDNIINKDIIKDKIDELIIKYNEEIGSINSKEDIYKQVISYCTYIYDNNFNEGLNEEEIDKRYKTIAIMFLNKYNLFRMNIDNVLYLVNLTSDYDRVTVLVMSKYLLNDEQIEIIKENNIYLKKRLEIIARELNNINSKNDLEVITNNNELKKCILKLIKSVK